MRSGQIKVFMGNSNPVLARDVCLHLGVPLGEALVGRFSNGEVRVEIGEDVRGMDVYVLQSTCRPVSCNIMELLLLLDALKRASAERINAVIPYFGYGRQDQKDKPRVSIAAKLMAGLIGVAGAGRIIAVDLHADQIEGFFDIPVDTFPGVSVLAQDIEGRPRGDEVIVAPDAGGVRRAREFARSLNADLAILDYRGVSSESAPMIVGDVKGRPVILFDDMVDTGGTLIRAARAAEAAGASSVDAFCVHAVLSGSAVSDLERSPIRRMVVTDTIPLPPEARGSERFRVVSVAPMIAEGIEYVHCNKPVR